MFVAFLVVSVCCAGSDVTTTVAASSTTFSDTNTTIMSDGNLSVPTALLARRMLSALDCWLSANLLNQLLHYKMCSPNQQQNKVFDDRPYSIWYIILTLITCTYHGQCATDWIEHCTTMEVELNQGGLQGRRDGIMSKMIWNCAPSPENFWTFYLEIALFGAFWGVFKVYIPICVCQFCDPKGDSLYGLMTKDISYNRPYASYMQATCIRYELLRKHWFYRWLLSH